MNGKKFSLKNSRVIESLHDPNLQEILKMVSKWENKSQYRSPKFEGGKESASQNVWQSSEKSISYPETAASHFFIVPIYHQIYL